MATVSPIRSPPPPIGSPIESPIESPIGPTTRQHTRHPIVTKKRKLLPGPGVYISPAESKLGQGACRQSTQQMAGKMLGLFTTLTLDTTTTVLEKEEATRIMVALKHDHLVNLRPTTKEECIRIALGEGSKQCECILHKHTPCSSFLNGLMTNASELDGELYSGNLTNIAVELLKYILLDKAGFDCIQVQPEVKSKITPSYAGSKVVYTLQDEDASLVVEATPDFYVRRFSPIVYILIGETESSGSANPELQLAIGSLGTLLKLRRTRIGACRFDRNLGATLYMGECTWTDDLGKVKFQRLQRTAPYKLTCLSDLEEFANLVVALVRECDEELRQPSGGSGEGV